MSVEVPTIEEEQVSPHPKKKIANENIASLEGPLKRIVNEAIYSIERGDYDLIIGLDASGRIPTLILSKIIGDRYRKNGFELPMIRFLAGGLLNREYAKEKIKTWNPKKKVLVIDDTVATGVSVESVASALRDLGIKFDFVVISNLHHYDYDDKHGADNFFSGGIESNDIYGDADLSGVLKEGGDTFSGTIKKKYNDDSPDVQENINEAREDVDTVARDITDWIESNKDELLIPMKEEEKEDE